MNKTVTFWIAMILAAVVAWFGLRMFVQSVSEGVTGETSQIAAPQHDAAA